MGKMRAFLKQTPCVMCYAFNYESDLNEHGVCTPCVNNALEAVARDLDLPPEAQHNLCADCDEEFSALGPEYLCENCRGSVLE